jgi:hypothetical protein
MKAIDWVEKYERSPRTTLDNAMSMMSRHFPHKVAIVVGKRQKEIDTWLLELIDFYEFVQVGSMFYFQDDLVAMQFKLTWR